MAGLRERVGLLVRHHRERVGLTQAELAERTARSLELIGRIERGVSAPSFETLEAFAGELGVPVAQFFELDGTAPDGPLFRIAKRLAQLSEEDLQWAEKLLTVALSRGRSRQPK
jgi:transcriptional regulator with XRE-family HTH domain